MKLESIKFVLPACWPRGYAAMILLLSLLNHAWDWQWWSFLEFLTYPANTI